MEAGRRWHVSTPSSSRGLALALLAMVALSASSGSGSEVCFPGYGPEGTRPGTLVTGHLYRPDGPGPFPAMALFHGSTGVLPYHHRWAQWLAREGYVALVVDSFGPRGVSRDSGGLTGERVWDAFGALAYLRSLAYVESPRIGAMGWSLGGAVALLAGGELFVKRAPAPGSFGAVVALYPSCASTDASELMTPVLFLLAAEDTWTPPERCLQVARELKESGRPVEWVVYKGASHGFDFGRGESKVAPINVDGHILRSDERATADAEIRTRRFLARHLPRRP